MKFEEEFPSLKDKQVDSIYYGREGYPEYQQKGDCLKIVDVEDYCRDNQRIREAIEKEIVGGPVEVYEMKIRLLKVLRL